MWSKAELVVGEQNIDLTEIPAIRTPQVAVLACSVTPVLLALLGPVPIIQWGQQGNNRGEQSSNSMKADLKVSSSWPVQSRNAGAC